VANPDYELGLGAGSGAFRALPGTAKEADAIAPKIGRLTHEEPRVLLRGAASEDVVKSLRSPRVLVLSTHGFFQDFGANADAVNPLVKCGLALAGANQAGNNLILSGDDGILLGIEAVGLDLRGTDLVVLSACQSGLGKVADGQGVKGLRQAFHLA